MSKYKNDPVYREKVRAASRERYRNRTPEERIAYSRLSRFGITQEQFNEILAEQSNRCAICETDKPTKWHLDHDHKTGRTRGILCHRCNVTLGFVEDDIYLLYAMVEYLTESKKRRLPGRSR